MSFKGKILIIDNDPDINNLFKIYLEHDGFQVDANTDPIDALYYFKKDEYDLVLLDLKMPKMNGVELFQELQNIDPALLFRFITAANKEYIENLKTGNPDIEENVIYKPFWLTELRTTVHSLLSNHNQQQQQQKEDKDKLLMLII